MKRMWLGAGLMLALLLLGLGGTWLEAWICEPVSRDLQAASELVQQEDWEQAQTLALQAKGRWGRYRQISAAITNHEPMEEVDALFRALEIYARQQDTVRFADCCARLASLTEAVAEAQAVWWWSIL